MNRRDVLRAIVATGGVGCAGCVSGASPSTDERRVSLDEQDSVPGEHDIQIEVEVLESTVTASGTAQLRVTTTNEGPQRALSVGTEGCAILNRQDCLSEPPGIWLYQIDKADSISRDSERWIPKPADRWSGFASYGCPSTQYDSGDSVCTEYKVWQDHRQDGYLQPGTYRWETGIRVGNQGQQADDHPSFTWGFSLSVAVPDND